MPKLLFQSMLAAGLLLAASAVFAQTVTDIPLTNAQGKTSSAASAHAGSAPRQARTRASSTASAFFIFVSCSIHHSSSS